MYTTLFLDLIVKGNTTFARVILSVHEIHVYQQLLDIGMYYKTPQQYLLAHHDCNIIILQIRSSVTGRTHKF